MATAYPPRGLSPWDVELKKYIDSHREDQTAVNAKALRRFHVSLTDQSTPTDIVVVGDSITEGLGASSWRKRWVNVLQDRLRASFNPPNVPGGAGYFNGWNQSGYPDWPCDPSNPVTDTNFGLGRQSLIMTTNGDSAIFETTPVITGFDLVVVKTSDASGATQIQYSVDGGATVTVDLTDASVSRGGYHLPVRGLEQGEHALIVASAAGNVIFEGIAYFNGDEETGVRVWEGGQSGFRAADYTAPNNLWLQSLIDIQPSLVILAVGSNDYETGRTTSQFSDDVVEICTGVETVLGYRPSFALVAYYERSHAGWEEFRQAYRDLSVSQNAALIDVSPSFGPWEDDTRGGLMAADKHHPSDAGSAIIGSAVAEILGAR